MAQPLILKNWETGIADSPHQGYALMRNVNLYEYPGAVKASLNPTTMFHTAMNGNFTADASTDVITVTSGGVAVQQLGTAVTFTTTGTLPAGLTAGTIYFLIFVTTTTAKLATTIANAHAGTAVDITDAGTGTHTITTVNPGTIKHIIRDPRTSDYYMHDSNGRVWYSESTRMQLLNGNTLTNAEGNGIVTLWNSDDTAMYLLVFRNALIDIVNVYGTNQRRAPSWTSGWNFGGVVSDSTLNSGAGSGNSHHAIRGQDDVIYFCDDRYVGSIRETAGQVFDPANTATYSGTDQALDLPIGEKAYWLEELDTDLLISGNNTNRIYPWNRIDDSFKLPYNCPESNVFRMKNIGDTIFIQAGRFGQIYRTQGQYILPFKKIPEYITNNTHSLSNSFVTWGGMDVVDGHLAVGISSTINSDAARVYLIDMEGRLTQDNTPPTGATAPTAILGPSRFYLMGYSGGASTMDTNRRTSLSCVVQSALIPVATKTEKAQYSVLEVVNAKKPTSGSGQVKVSYRADTLSAFTEITTFTFNSSNDAIQNYDAGLTDIENIQVQVELDGVVELVEVRFLQGS